MIRIAVVMGKMHAGGKKNLVMEYYRHIDRNKVQFDFICDEDSNSIPYEEIDALGGKVYIVPPYQHIVANVMTMIKIMKKNKYPIIHAYNSTMNFFSMFAGKIAGIPVRINESISMGHKDDKKNILKTLLKPFSTCFSTHYMSNGEICGRWQFGNKLFDSKQVKVFKTVIDSEKNKYEPSLRQLCREENCISSNLVIGHIGRFTAQKNTLFIIEIFNSILKKCSNAKLLMIGYGDLEQEMKKKIHEYGIENSILLLGKREDIHQFYNAMDCFLLPSLYEGLPVVGVEAECCGLPVFFSSEIPVESSPCDDLGFFIGLDKSAEEWGNLILNKTMILKEKRRNRSVDIQNAGFDSFNEGRKLTEYYLQNIKSKGDKA